MKSNKEWEKWGKTDPLWAVASWDGKDKSGQNPWTDEDFYALGKQDWADFSAQWNQYGMSTDHCIEIGCGAGRLSMQIANTFTATTAVDISEDQLAYAQNRVKNVRFLKGTGDSIPESVQLASGVFSAHVFQHFSSAGEAHKLFQSIFDKLSPSGTMMIHLPIYNIPKNRIEGLMRRQVQFFAALTAIAAEIKTKLNLLHMRGTWYDQDLLSRELKQLGFSKIEFRTFQVSSNGAWHSFVFATKN